MSQVIQIYNWCTSITAEGWTKLVSLHIVYVSAPSFIYHTSCLCITIALKSRHPDDPGVANSSSCSEGAVQNTYTKTKENLAHFQHVLGLFLDDYRIGWQILNLILTDIWFFMLELDSLIEFLHSPLYITIGSPDRISIVPVGVRWLGLVEMGSTASMKFVNLGASSGSSAVP